MARIRFKNDQIYETLGHKKGPLFPAGFVLDEEDVGKALGVRSSKEHAASFIDRWLQRGEAELVDGTVPASDPKTVTVVGAPVAPLVVDTAEPEPAATLDLTKLTRAELDTLAADRGVDISGAANKDDVIAALQLADEAAV